MPNLAQAAHKVTYLVSEYPEKPLNDIVDDKGQVIDNGLLSLLALPSIDINTAFWYAQEQGWLTEPDAKGFIKLLKKPSAWSFGPEEKRLEDLLLFGLECLNAKERDLEEYFVSKWTMGYPSHDVLIAMKRLLATKKLHEYQIEDGDSNYIFYTLYANRDKLFGRKEFKKDPLAGIEKRK